MRVGFIGMGLMGVPMAKRLLQAGIDLSIWNRTAVACEPLHTVGAHATNSARELAASVDVLMLCVTDSAAVEAICHGADGVFAGAHSGLIVVDHSSIAADVTRQLAAELRQIANAEWVDAPVSGGVTGAENGRLVIMAGGKATAIDAARPILEHYSQRITRMGDVGAGQVTKICNQLIVAANSVLIAEAMALAERAGVDARLLAPALAGGFADSLPFQVLSPRMAERRFTPVQWKVSTLAKDLGNAQALSAQVNLDTPLAAHALQRLQAHAGNGFADADLSSVIAHYLPDLDVGSC